MEKDCPACCVFDFPHFPTATQLPPICHPSPHLRAMDKSLFVCLLYWYWLSGFSYSWQGLVHIK